MTHWQLVHSMCTPTSKCRTRRRGMPLPQRLRHASPGRRRRPRRCRRVWLQHPPLSTPCVPWILLLLLSAPPCLCLPPRVGCQHTLTNAGFPHATQPTRCTQPPLPRASSACHPPTDGLEHLEYGRLRHVAGPQQRRRRLPPLNFATRAATPRRRRPPPCRLSRRCAHRWRHSKPLRRRHCSAR